MSQRYPVPESLSARTHLDEARYRELYQRSVEQPERFWSEQASALLDWSRTWDEVHSGDMRKGQTRWFSGGQLNVAYNCIDRHLGARAERTAILWEGDDPADSQAISYRQLHEHVSRLANVLKGRGVRKGDRVCLYMPMIPEAAYAMLACARIGAVHSVVFGGFSPEALRDRILDSDCRVVITADEGVRGGKRVPLKANVDKALAKCPEVHTVVMVERTGAAVARQEGRDLPYAQAVAAASPDCPPEPMDAEDPLFILYTSGSTGKPKGVLHTTGGYLLGATLSFKYLFDYHEGQVFWCTADVGWVTGHSYIVYGPLANGATTLLFEGIPNYPDITRMSKIIDKHKVNILYTAPTAIRAMMAEGTKAVEGADGSSLRLLGSVGEPINPEAWNWYYNTVGKQNCPIVDTWWQTETGDVLISPLPGATALKPGSATKPFFGVIPALVDNLGNLIEGAAEGNLVILDSWPGQSRSLYGDHDRFVDTYFKTFRGMYFTGDGARRD
ncbi:acetate--CoA ligase, partial [uncultured Pseudomonas sp.]|uniref:acetate--CoA ligase n=1 Tax=uncultured Pseudomonas sp. TaxID=114707 RepID=UPI00258E2600